MKFISSVFLAAVAMLVVELAQADVHLAPERRDYPVDVTSTVAFDAATHLYTYTYTVTNRAGNPRPVDYFSIRFQPGVDVITDVTSPRDWTYLFGESDSDIRWGGTEVASYIPADYVDDGHSIPPFGPWIKPGATLSGFSFKTSSPPGPGMGISQTFAPLPWADDAEELENLPYSSTLPEENGYRFTTTTPIPELDAKGNRRPSVDGLLTIADAQDKADFQGFALVVIRFAVGGETVDMESFHVTLNSYDVTSRFEYSDIYKGYAAVFLPDHSPLMAGNNVLWASVDGSLPGAKDRTVTDTDRLSFKFTP